MSLESFDIPEKTCPLCGTHVSRRREGMYCPCCGASLFTYRHGRGKKAKTIWVTDEPRVKDLAEYVKEKVRMIPGMETYDWASITHMKQQYGSATLLLRACEGNQALAFTVVDFLYDNEKRRRNGVFGDKPKSVGGIISKYSGDKLAVAIAVSKREIGYMRVEPRQEATQESF